MWKIETTDLRSSWCRFGYFVFISFFKGIREGSSYQMKSGMFLDFLERLQGKKDENIDPLLVNDS